MTLAITGKYILPEKKKKKNIPWKIGFSSSKTGLQLFCDENKIFLRIYLGMKNSNLLVETKRGVA